MRRGSRQSGGIPEVRKLGKLALRLAAALPIEIWQARRVWHDRDKVLSGKNLKLSSKATLQDRRRARVS